MISYVAKVLSFFASTIQSIFQIASFIGEIIVYILSTISSLICNISGNVILFLQIVYEDNITIFSEDLPNIANDMIKTVHYQMCSMQQVFSTLFFNACLEISETVTSIKWLVDSMGTIIYELLRLLKNIIIFMGNTIWFMLTFIPIHLPQILEEISKNVFELTVSAVVDAYMTLLRVTNFLTDVPLEAFIGITSAIVIVRLCVYFKDTILFQLSMYYWSLIRKFWYHYYAIYNYFIDTEVRDITLMSGQEIAVRETSSHSGVAVVDDANSADALCVICQERQKCVLTLPCRHVCLCTECCMRLYGYQRTCPICRTFIYHSVTIYL